jgi:phosphatidylglycerophosphatase A
MAAPDISDAMPVEPRTGTTAARSATLAFMGRHPSRWIALGLGSGLARHAPGTIGTLWAWALFLLLDRWLGAAGWGALIGASLVAGTWACQRTAQDLGQADPGCIVWDEIVSFWIVLWLVMPAGFVAQVVAFALFRAFDALKPGPIGYVDRRFKRATGWRQGVGILADDLVAALCTLLVIALWRFAFP